VELLPVLAADVDVDADPLPEAWAPDLLACTELCDCVEVPDCTERRTLRRGGPSGLRNLHQNGKNVFHKRAPLWAESILKIHRSVPSDLQINLPDA